VLEHTADVTDLQWLIVRTVGFVVLAAIVLRFIVPVIRGMLGARRQAIVETDQQVGDTLVESERMRDEYRAKLERIAEETSRRLEEAVREAEELQASIRHEARDLADAIVERTTRELRREREKTMAHLRIEFTDDVIEAARYAAARTITRERQADLVRLFVREIGSGR
jgi:F-type H+-transporting ATPase subunit b